MADAFDDWYVGTVDVDTVGKPDEWGGQPITSHKGVECQIEDVNQMVRDRDGQEVVSTATLSLSLDKADWFTPGSIVKIRGRESRVISIGITDIGDAELDGIEVRLA